MAYPCAHQSFNVSPTRGVPHRRRFSFTHCLRGRSTPGSSSSEAWPTWSSLNRLRTGTGRCKSLMQKWEFNEDGQTTCECGDKQTTKHLLVCPILPQTCTHEGMEEFNPEVDPAPSIGRESCSDSRRRNIKKFSRGCTLISQSYLLRFNSPR